MNGAYGQVDYVAVAKVVSVGDPYVGKTSLMQRFTQDRFDNQYLTTVGVDFLHHAVQLKCGKWLMIQIWDTAGQERFNSFTGAFYRGAHVFVLVYDIAARQTFENIGIWYERIMEQQHDNEYEMVLVGNKSDLSARRDVTATEGLRLALQLRIDHFMETSAATGDQVERCFTEIAERYYSRFKRVCASQLESIGGDPEPVLRGEDLQRIPKLPPPRRRACCGGGAPAKSVSSQMQPLRADPVVATTLPAYSDSESDSEPAETKESN